MTKITKITESKNPLKRPISPSSSSSSEREPKRQTIANNTDDTNMPINKPSSNDLHSLDSIEGNASFTQALGPLITEFRLLRESVDTVHHDYADLKQTISKQKEELKQDLADKIDKNTNQLMEVSHKNKILQKENEHLKTSLHCIEQIQLLNNVIITGIPEGPYEQYSITRLRVQEMIAVTIDSGDTEADLAKAKGIEITSCN